MAYQHGGDGHEPQPRDASHQTEVGDVPDVDVQPNVDVQPAPTPPTQPSIHTFLADAVRDGRLTEPFDGELRLALAEFTAGVTRLLFAGLGSGQPQQPPADAGPAERFEFECCYLAGTISAVVQALHEGRIAICQMRHYQQQAEQVQQAQAARRQSDVVH